MRFLLLISGFFILTGCHRPSHKLFRKLLSFCFLSSVIIAVTAQQPQSVRFAFLTDLHVTPSSTSDSNLFKIVEEVNTLDIDFVVVTGDLTNTGSNSELVAVKKSLDRINKPLYVIQEIMKLYAATRNGLLVAIDTADKTIRWKCKAGNSSVNKMIISNKGTIWMTLMEGLVVAIKIE